MLGTTVTLYNTLDELGIDYTEVTHPAVTTMEAAQFVRTLIDGTPVSYTHLDVYKRQPSCFSRYLAALRR